MQDRATTVRCNNTCAENGFKPEYWDAFSEAMCELAARWKIKANRVETVQAWRLLVLFLVSKVKQGWDLEMADCRSQQQAKLSIGSSSAGQTPASQHKRSTVSAQYLTVDTHG